MINNKIYIKYINNTSAKNVIGKIKEGREKETCRKRHILAPQKEEDTLPSQTRSTEEAYTPYNSDDRLTSSSYKDGNKCNYLQENHLQTASPKRSLHIHRNTTKGYS